MAGIHRLSQASMGCIVKTDVKFVGRDCQALTPSVVSLLLISLHPL